MSSCFEEYATFFLQHGVICVHTCFGLYGKIKYFYDNAGRLVKAEIDSNFDGELDQTCLTILDDRGTLIVVANEGQSPVDNTRFAGAH